MNQAKWLAAIFTLVVLVATAGGRSQRMDLPTVTLEGGESIEISFADLLENVNENNFRALQLKLDLEGELILYPFCIANDSAENVWADIYNENEEAYAFENLLVENGTRFTCQFEKGTLLTVTLRTDDYSLGTWSLLNPPENDRVWWLVVTDSLEVRREERPLADKGELVSGHALGLDFGYIVPPPRKMEFTFSETVKELEQAGWILITQDEQPWGAEIIETVDNLLHVVASKNSWFAYPYCVTPEWSGTLDLRFTYRPENYPENERWINSAFLLRGQDVGGEPIEACISVHYYTWARVILVKGLVKSWADGYPTWYGKWIYYKEFPDEETAKRYILSPHTVRVVWGIDNVMHFWFDEGYAWVRWLNPIGSKYRWQLFDTVDGRDQQYVRGAYYGEFVISEVAPPPQPIVVIPAIENLHLVKNKWRANYNLTLTTDYDDVDNVHSFYLSPEQVKALLKNAKLSLKNLGSYPIRISGEIKVMYANKTNNKIQIRRKPKN